MNENELTPEERAAFDALPRERESSRLLEERTVGALRDRGLLRPTIRGAASGLVRAVAAAAAIVVFVGGFAAGRATAPDLRGRDHIGTTAGARDSVDTMTPIRGSLEPSRIVWL